MTTTTKHTDFSFEVLPPLRGKGLTSVYNTIDRLMPYNPVCVNITTHRAETVYNELPNGTFQKLSVRNRPGTVAIAAAIKERYHIHTVPHIICSGFTASEIESELIDLSYLGITDLLLLRGDRAKGDNRFIATPGGYEHATELCKQVNDFNNGQLLGGMTTEPLTVPFTFGVAGYPEKHDEAMNLDTDIAHLKAKVAMGAKRIVTQMFFDNSKYFAFVERLRSEGITIPVIPGIKPLTTLNHCTMLPRTFHIDFPQELACEFEKCRTNDDVKALGVEWGIQQVRELKEAGVPIVHFYTMNAAYSTELIIKQSL
jgi:methylenetetrahydrofolate reductase (NAD(P)H)